jgi:alkylation response protein AidB-like acyl-CoA dehydrogenase
MHLAAGLVFGRILREAREADHDQMAAGASALLATLGSGAIVAANITEVGTDYRHPLTEAVKVDGGWSITGRKTFSTLSPVADLFFVSIRAQRDDGAYVKGSAIVPRGSAGQAILDNWEALGMRASASNDILYDSCFVADDFVVMGSPWGQDDPMTLVIATAGNFGLVGCFLGLAEAAWDIVVNMARTRTKAPSNRPIAESHGIQHQVAEMKADLETCRAVVERAGRAIDQYLFVVSPDDVTLNDLHGLNAQYQCAKLVANRKAIEVVDRALTISGGAGYMSANLLSRLYRDVRAGPFMQPFSPNEAYEYIGRVALGLSPVGEG